MQELLKAINYLNMQHKKSWAAFVKNVANDITLIY